MWSARFEPQDRALCRAHFSRMIAPLRHERLPERFTEDMGAADLAEARFSILLINFPRCVPVFVPSRSATAFARCDRPRWGRGLQSQITRSTRSIALANASRSAAKFVANPRFFFALLRCRAGSAVRVRKRGISVHPIRG